jgi:Spx/MgsR family transcriptional regulator
MIKAFALPSDATQPLCPMSTPTRATVYGIPNCTTVKKALEWLTAADLPFQFHDFKKSGVPDDALAHWVEVVGWEPLVNRKGTTWRKVDATRQASIQNAASATTLMRDLPSVIKRPVVHWPDGSLTVGFSADQFAAKQSSQSS